MAAGRLCDFIVKNVNFLPLLGGDGDGGDNTYQLVWTYLLYQWSITGHVSL